ncbi:MAG TPA: hydroxymyristoyl-ACP dehydratase, partial [Lysobacter sp.]|nr:hydroxymyristoyl-ACP dehydratase [Lysobacter sp.]
MIRVSSEVTADHPSLAGHFPGHPIVPAAVLLSRVFAAAASACGAAVIGLPAVKFLAPLAPGDQFNIEFEKPGASGAVKFSVVRGSTVIAAGSL